MMTIMNNITVVSKGDDDHKHHSSGEGVYGHHLP